MEQFEVFNIDKFEFISDAKPFLNTLEGEWYPQDLNTSPLKFILSTSNNSYYVCKGINKESNQLTLHNKNNDSIVLEVYIHDSNKLSLSIINPEALGASPKMTFIKKKL
ncbi:TPA: staphostatin A [Staphylococcus aureus]|uniref:staphostatin A n=1 Tax=Staphylococcus aureus TaxID=1280 RepID=UPI0028DE63F5|nr:staphostatin A [Staphylococcus aureus]WOL36280.1 staphostatin A [Staphylococcus aureus]HDL0564138.1 staphostatin A [Staphylococcus aureus]HDL0566840.1 staphostatin A [Staphylococcus aureus]HDL0618743.1 staphostatin A [Staphylococcus aureus]HDL0637930.1 staphostatin A [Staphylococcus aureus]